MNLIESMQTLVTLIIRKKIIQDAKLRHLFHLRLQTDRLQTVRDSMFNLHDIFCIKDASERQKLSALNGIMGLLGSEQGLFIVSHCTAPNIL